MGKLAFVFAGQGAQYTGMGRELALVSDASRAVFQEADRIRPGTGDECFESSTEHLSKTRITQPCVFCVCLAAAAALREKGIVPEYAAGFSLGEVAALSFAGYLSFEDAFKFVCRRGELMHQCAEDNKAVMYAVVGISPEGAETIVSEFEGVWTANYNCGTQTVVSCRISNAEGFTARVKDFGGRALKLAVSGGFHSPLMDNAVQRLEVEFGKLCLLEPQISVISNRTAKEYQGMEDLFGQINSPVLWQKSILQLLELGVTDFIETGPGKTLSGLIRKISPESKVMNVENAETLRRALEVYM